MDEQREFRPDTADEEALPPLLERRGYVNPQEANVTSDTPTKSTKSKKKKKKDAAAAAIRKPPRPSTSPPSDVSSKRPPRATASRLALEEVDDGDGDTRPMLPPKRKDTKGSSTFQEDTKPPAEPRTLYKKRSNSDTSLSSVPMPPSLTYQTTDPISNTTGRGRAPQPSPSPLPLVTPSDREAASDPRLDCAFDGSLSSRSTSLGSIGTEGTMNTMELVLAKRYAAYYGGNPTASERATEEENARKAAAAAVAPQPLPAKRAAWRDNPRNQLTRDEKQRQSSGYVSEHLDKYSTARRNVASKGHKNATCLESFEDEHDEHSLDNESLSTAPGPPSLHLRDHYMRPGAYRIRRGEEGRHVDNDSVASSSLRTLSTIRTNLGLGAIEASLVEDATPPNVEATQSQDTDMIHTRPSLNCFSDHTATSDDHQYTMANSRTNSSSDDDEDYEFPSAPSPAAYTVSGGGMTFATTSTCSQVVEAQPFDEQHTIRAFFKRKKIRCMICFLVLVFLCLTIGTVYAVTGFADGQFKGNGGGGTENNDGDDVEASPAPSSSPTSQGDLQLEYFVDVALPSYTRNALRRASSPQRKAFDWLLNNTMLASYPLPRRLQRYALATLYFSTGGEKRWNKNFGWLSDEDECEWFSMEIEVPVCGENGFKILSLSSNSLRGTLPLEISLLSSLELLQVNENILTGFLPTSLGGLEQLREIHLSQIMPPQLGQLKSLKQLLLDRNTLVGPIPRDFGQLEQLEVLYMYENLFTGTIATDLGHLSDLIDFELDMNALSGTVPSEIGMWNKLQTFNLGNNTLSGTIPTEIGQMTTVKHIDLFSNDMAGPLPTELGLLTSLERLFLEMNSFEGRLPLQIVNLQNLKQLWLFSNKFQGVLSHEIGSLSKLKDLDISKNSFTGLLPTEVGLLTELEVINLSSNLFSGQIPTELGLLTNLKEILLDNNNFSGTMPLEVCRLTTVFKLQTLRVNCTSVLCNCCRMCQ
ncbi:MAG: hypothetical protein SGILL_000066 [Bacillariaceae sp.]